MKITELEAQIEKMKCCGNYVHFDFNEPNYCHKEFTEKDNMFVVNGVLGIKEAKEK